MTDIILCCRPYCGEPACASPNAEREYLCEVCMDEWLQQSDEDGEFDEIERKETVMRNARAL